MIEETIVTSEAEHTGNAVKSTVLNMNEVSNLILPRLTTEELAAILRVKPQTIRAGLCNAGHYAGLRPAVKLPSRRLLWDAEQVAAVVNG